MYNYTNKIKSEYEYVYFRIREEVEHVVAGGP